ncbi:HAD hydrolase family protein, partial [Streptococcus sp. DD04]
GGNDLEMLSYCGESYAMANATDEVKARAKYICPSNDDDGVLTILQKVFL